MSIFPKPQTRHFVQIALLSLVVTIAAWKWLEWKGVVSFVPLWMLFEISHRLRARAQLACTQCGFDPYLFLIDSDRAKTAIREFWKKKTPEVPPPLDGPPPQR